MAQSPSKQELSQIYSSAEIEELISKPDAVLNSAESKDDELLLQYAKARAREKNATRLDREDFAHAVKAFEKSYRGYAPMCNVLLDFMVFFDDPKAIHDKFLVALKKSIYEIHGCDSETIMTLMKQLKNPNLHSSSNSSNSSNASNASNGNNEKPKSREELQQEIKELKERQSQLSDQIEECIVKSMESQNSRKLMTSANTNKDGMGMLSRLSQIEDLKKFENMIKMHLKQLLLSTSDAQSYKAKFTKFANLVLKNELYYIECFHVLAQFRRQHFGQPIDFAIIKIEHELQQFASDKLSQLNIRRFFDLSIWSQGINFDNECRTAPLELLKKGTLSTADLSKLYTYYHNAFKTREQRNKTAPDRNHFHLLMIQMLQSEKMTSYLVQVLFTSATLFVNGRSRTLKHQQFLPKYVFLFAYSVTARFGRISASNSNKNSSNSNNSSSSSASLFASAGSGNDSDDPDIGMDGENGDEKGNKQFETQLVEQTDGGQLERLSKKLTEICLICEDKDYGNQLSEHKNKQDLLFESVQAGNGDKDDFSSLIAYGVYKWIFYCMMTRTSSYFDLTSEPYLTPLFISLLSEIALNHEYLRKDIVHFCVGMIQKHKNGMEGMAEITFCESFLELVMFIMQLGNYVSVFNALDGDFLEKLDRKMCRALIHNIVDTIKPPLPTDFVHLFFNMLNCQNVTAAIKNEKNSTRELKEYVNSISKSNLPPNWRDVIDKISESKHGAF